LNEFWERIKALLRPREIVKDIRAIDFGKLKARGIRALILDIDDTLIPKDVNDVVPAVFEWVVSRKEEGFKLCLTTNSRHPLRVKYIGETLGIPSIFMGFKPLPFSFWKSLEILGAKPEETAMIGDPLLSAEERAYRDQASQAISALIPPDLPERMDRNEILYPKEYLKEIPERKQVLKLKPTSDCPMGTRGREAVFEMYEMSREIEDVILRNPVESAVYDIARKQGMVTMREHAIVKALQGRIPWEEVNKL